MHTLHKRALSITFGLLLSLVIFGAAEWSFRQLNQKRYYREVIESEKPWYYPDPMGAGRRMTPNNSINFEYWDGDELAARVTYKIDEFGRRYVPSKESSTKTIEQKHLLLFGDSTVFGGILETEETLPVVINESQSSYRAYNYGVPSHGATHFLAYIQNTDLKKEVAEPTGALVYFLSNAILKRSFGMHFYNSSFGLTPYYHFNEKMDLVRNGTLGTTRPIRTAVLGFLGTSEILRYFDYFMNQTFEWTFDSRKTALFSAVIEETRKSYLERFPGSRFILVFQPHAKYPKEIVHEIAQRGIETIDLKNSPLNERKPEFYRLPKDGHPSRYFNERVAELVIQRLSSGTPTQKVE